MMGNVIQHVSDDENDYYVLDNQENGNYSEEYCDQEENGGDNDDQDGNDVDNSNYIYIINTVLSGTARLNVLLPTFTILTFTIFASILTNDGQCTTLDRWLMGFFLASLASSCVFFSFTDSFRTANGRLYYGVATIRGIRIFGGGRIGPLVSSYYRLKWGDTFHASLSLIAFLTFALLHNDVLSCYNVVLPRKFINSFPLVVGFVVSVLFVMFPSTRRGIGYPFLLQSDVVRMRN